MKTCNENVRELEKLNIFIKETSMILNIAIGRRNNQIKCVNKGIFKFKSIITKEVMRLMMMPEIPKDISIKCKECKEAGEILKFF